MVEKKALMGRMTTVTWATSLAARRSAISDDADKPFVTD
jgi:hypothetical protein